MGRLGTADPAVKTLLLDRYHSRNGYSDTAGWWRDAEILRLLGPALAGLHPDVRPTAVMGIESKGFFLAGLVALHLGVGVVEVSKGRVTEKMELKEWVARTPPDYLDRDLELSVPRYVLTERDRILFVDDWLDTGAQATAAAQLVERAGAEWLGASVIIARYDWQISRKLELRSLLTTFDLSD